MIFTEYDEIETMNIMKKESWDDGYAEGEAEGRANGRAKGETKGADRVSKLYLYLMSNSRNADMEKAMRDADYRDQLLKTLNM
ncbi:hypothetical protein SAMN05216390_1065 [Lachnospiraceae bacterium KH1T2]|nr:hypothetical protein SAMN05216390_1065 [Lachnospiraceae bacterium KH1T2]